MQSVPGRTCRLPRGENIATPPSHCVCGTPIAPRDNIPVVSWLLLRGRARCCNAKISFRYPLVELIGGALAWAVVETTIFAMPLDTPYAALLIADHPVVVQFTRHDTSQAANAIATTLAFAG